MIILNSALAGCIAAHDLKEKIEGFIFGKEDVFAWA